MKFLILFLIIGSASMVPNAYSNSPPPAVESMRQVIVEKAMTCGPSDIRLATRFQEIDEHTGHALTQTLTVTSETRHIVKFSYRPFEQGIYDDSMVWEVQCLRTRDNRWLLELSSTNYGNCAGCEWADYFDIRGAYIGSTREQFGAIGFKYHRVSEQDSAVINSAKILNSQRAIRITRAVN